MKYSFIIAAALMIAAPLTAAAQERLTDGAYVRAVRCVAYADLPQLQGDAFNASPLQQAVETYSGPSFMRQSGRDASRMVRVAGSRAGDDATAVSHLREQRDEVCGGFIASGLVQASANSNAS